MKVKIKIAYIAFIKIRIKKLQLIILDQRDGLIQVELGETYRLFILKPKSLNQLYVII